MPGSVRPVVNISRPSNALYTRRQWIAGLIGLWELAMEDEVNAVGVSLRLRLRLRLCAFLLVVLVEKKVEG